MNTTLPLAHLGGLSADDFLRDYWQKKPLLVRNAFPDLALLAGKEDLIELAQEDSIEARIILEKDGRKPWELRKGPFTAKQFRQLPATHWTLLVQAVDHYFPELALYWERFAFIPGWRIDDIMISYAAPEGSVGPHYDQYDVFLVQGSGQRRWQLGDYCDQNTPRLAGTPLRILDHMPVTFDAVVNPGDLLYVPPRLAHFGVAQGECLTYSFGFRAPALNQLLEHLVDAALEQHGADILYADPGLQAQRHNALLNPQHLRDMHQRVLALLDDPALLTRALAPFLSEAKYEDYEPAGETLAPDELIEALRQGAQLCRDPASRMLYVGEPGRAEMLYINGEEVDFMARGEFIALLTDHRQLGWTELHSWLTDPHNLDWLCARIADGFWLVLEN